MTFLTMIYCSTCKKVDQNLIRRSVTQTRHSFRQYMTCRECNNKKQRDRYVSDPARGAAYVYKSIKKYPERQRARERVRDAIKRKELKKPNDCENCGATGVPIEGHHEDYTKPLEVIWVCRECHRTLDK